MATLDCNFLCSLEEPVLVVYSKPVSSEAAQARVETFNHQAHRQPRQVRTLSFTNGQVLHEHVGIPEEAFKVYKRSSPCWTSNEQSAVLKAAAWWISSLPLVLKH